MNTAQANRHLAAAGFPGLSVSKAEGVWYVVGHEGVTQHGVERCLHVVRLADLDVDTLSRKLTELTK